MGDDGCLIASRNGGQTWSPMTRHAVGGLRSIGFSDDGRRGWAVGVGGTVLRTEDGGATWRRQTSGTTGELGGLHVSGDGQRAWATDRTSRRMLQTMDGGARWEPGVLAPEAQTLMQRPRRKWERASSHLWPTGVRDGYVDLESRRGWAVGDDGLLLTSYDEGLAWNDPRAYARYPAPWYWLALLLSAPMFVRSWRLFTRARQVVAGMADTPATDAALTDPKQDRLNFEPLAAGISRFLRNPATEPPLTLAITGDWGSGKSSLMGLVCADLRKHGSRPIWFNAWHHQKEDHLFAALLGALSTQTLPPWLSVDGIGFRMRLLWMRSRKHWVFTVLLCAAVALLATLHAGMNDPVAEMQLMRRVGQALGVNAAPERTDRVARPAKTATAAAPATAAVASEASGAASGATSGASGAAGGAAPDAASSAASSVKANAPPTAASIDPIEEPPLPWAEWLALLTVAGTTLAALRKALTAFGADPAALLAGGLQGMKPKLAAEQNSFRTRFAEQFCEVSRALPERVVVVIDDLDRCRPEAVLEIMEAVNFLTSSGQCFVLFGMATDKVQAALAIAFERIAKELASASISEGNPEQAAREQRRAYAANYLQKLINLEIKVPTAQSYEAWRLLTDDPATTAPSSWPRAFAEAFHRHAMWLALVVAIAGGVSLGVVLRPEAAARVESPGLVGAAASPPASGVVVGQGADLQGGSPPGSTPAPQAAGSASAGNAEAATTQVLVQSGDEGRADAWIVVGVLVIGVAAAGLLLLRAANRRHRAATDSKDFRDALKVWTDLIRESAHTPRAVKRFGNKLRYFEMLQQGEERDRTLLDDAKERWHRLIARGRLQVAGEESSRKEPNRRIAAPQLVALGAMQEAFGPSWLAQAKSLRRDGSDLSSSNVAGPADDPLAAKARQLFATHAEMFGTVWPPSLEELDVFERLLDGIRMPGESEEVRITPPAEEQWVTKMGSRPPSRSDVK